MAGAEVAAVRNGCVTELGRGDSTMMKEPDCMGVIIRSGARIGRVSAVVQRICQHPKDSLQHYHLLHHRMEATDRTKYIGQIGQNFGWCAPWLLEVHPLWQPCSLWLHFIR